MHLLGNIEAPGLFACKFASTGFDVAVLLTPGRVVDLHNDCVDRFAIIMPMAQSARTLGLKILDGPLMGLELTTWSEVRGSAGAVHICSWILPGGPQHPKIQHLLQHWVANLPRCPWRWTFGERSKIGFLLPTWKKSRRSFESLGFNTDKNAWPYVPTSKWMNQNEEE